MTTVRDNVPVRNKPPKKYLVLDPSATRFSDRLRYLMDYHGVSARQLGVATFLQRATILAYLGGRKGLPQIECAMAIADYFEVSLDWLFGRTDDMRIHKEGDHEQS